jgi:hypothetical protein
MVPTRRSSLLPWTLALAAALAPAPAGSSAPPRLEELTVALIGDTGAGTGFTDVLKLVAAEGASVLMINGDLGYSASAEDWKKRLTETIDTDQIRVIGALGNHDVSEKEEYVAAFHSLRTPANGLAAACTGQPAIAEGQDVVIADETCTFGNVTIVTSGIGQVLDKKYLVKRLDQKLGAAPDANWKLVGYHFTLASMNPGVKLSENTPEFFDVIRRHGAIGAQAHTHTVMASCPISSTFKSGLTPPSCDSAYSPASPEDRFVRPGVGVYVDSSLGGEDIRGRNRCKDPNGLGCSHMVDLITEEGYTRVDGARKKGLPAAGALFITFNHGGDPDRALALFKTVDGREVFRFTVVRPNAKTPGSSALPGGA